jgi:hypothetical protein
MNNKPNQIQFLIGFILYCLTLCHKTLIEQKGYFILEGHSVTFPRPETVVPKIISHLANPHDTKMLTQTYRIIRQNLSPNRTLPSPTFKTN